MNKYFLENIGPQIKVVNTLIEKELNNRISNLMTDYKLTGPQISLMVYLYEASDRVVTQKEVADKFVLSHPTMRSIVKRMATNHLLELNPLVTDKRQIVLSLTVTAQNLLDKHIKDIYAVMDDVNQQIVHDLTDEEIVLLSKMLSKIIKDF